jgi:hypothetical protein
MSDSGEQPPTKKQKKLKKGFARSARAKVMTKGIVHDAKHSKKTILYSNFMPIKNHLPEGNKWLQRVPRPVKTLSN